MEDTRASASEAKTEALLLKIEHAENYSPVSAPLSESDNEFGDYQSSPPSSLQRSAKKRGISAPIAIPPSGGTESEISTVSKGLLKELKTKLKINEETIANLKHQNATLQQKVVANSSRYGQIEVGLVYHPVAAKLEIHCFNASGIQGSCHTIRKVQFLSKNSILTKTQHFHEFFNQIFLDNFSREIKVVNS